MTEFEWVRELNEGVKKIYSDMAEAGLPEPEYIETPNTVKLILWRAFVKLYNFGDHWRLFGE